MNCKYCGAELPNDARFCPSCGKDLSNLRTCVKCGKIIDDDAIFCPYCGAEQPEYLEDSSYKKWIKIIVFITVLVGLGTGVWFYHENQVEKQRQAVIADSIATQDSIKRVGQEQAAIAKAKDGSFHRANSIAIARKEVESVVISNDEFVKKDFTLAGDVDQGDDVAHVILHVTIFNAKHIKVVRNVRYQDFKLKEFDIHNQVYDYAYFTNEFNGKNTSIEWITNDGDCINSLVPQNETGTSWEYGCGMNQGNFYGTLTLQK